MKPTILQEPLPQVSADVLVVPLFEGAPPPEELDAPLGGMLSQVVGTDFRGEADETLLLYTGGRVASPKLVLVGLGKEERVSPRRLFRTAAVGARAARKGGGRRMALAVPAVAAIPPEQVARFMTEGALHGLYRFPTFKSEEKARPEVESLALVGGPELEPGAERGAIVAEAVNLARELTWLPGNHLTARQLAERAEQLCRESGIDVTVYDREGCRELGLGLLLAVNQGSREEPRFVVMRYRGNGGRGPWLGLVGKGIMFDSGGISIKPNEGMWHMKDDMGGAAAVLGAMQAIARLNPAADVMGVIALTDNMPDGGAYKPGDVIVGLSGKTVEIRSTDAEGRLVLADALAYAASQNCTRLITVATLTGAAQIALGPVRFAMVSNDDAWEAQVWEAAEAAGERGWRLPHDEEYYDLFKSPIADMTNSGKPRTAGTVVGGLFLMKHAGETPCVHLDIAAQVWQEEPDAAADAGATGVGVRTLVETALRWAEVRE